MATFGTGAFSSDGAVDLLEELAERPVERRAAALAHMFRFVKDKPELLWREFYPDQVVAAAAIVAATLPGGEQFGARLEELADSGLTPDARLAAPAPDLANAALEALLFVAGAEGSWHQGWTSEADATEARDTIGTLSLVLARAGRHP